MKAVLLTVDIQSDYLARTGLAPDSDKFVASMESALSKIRDRGWIICHCRTRVSKDGSDWMPHWQRLGRALCVADTTGYEPPLSLSSNPEEKIFHKRYYSAFEDEELSLYLNQENIDTLIVAGVYTHACIRSTVTDAYAKGFRVFIPTDLVASYDPKHAGLTIDWLSGRAAECMTIDSILEELDN
jgi:alpha-ketoglutaric semialdehyde dehydrogenase